MPVPPLGLRPQSYRLIQMVVTFVAAFVVAIYPFWDALPPGTPRPPGYGANGYAWSLALFGVPMAVLLFWFWRSKPFPCQKKAFWTSTGIVFVLWGLLDVFFAHHLFCFPKKLGRSGLNLYGYMPQGNDCSEGLSESLGGTVGWGWNVPFEEFAFYLGAVMVVLLLYMWASQRWFDKYHSDEGRYTREADRVVRALQLHPVTIGLGVLLFLLCWVYKKTIPDVELRDGFPWYALFLIGIVIVPNGLLYRAAGRLVNERALLFTMTVAILVSLLWEVTLAKPEGWWDYQPDKTIGMRIHPWGDLPVEAAALWFAAAWGNVTIYEILRLYFHSPRTLSHLLTGRGNPVRRRASRPVLVRPAKVGRAS